MKKILCIAVAMLSFSFLNVYAAPMYYPGYVTVYTSDGGSRVTLEGTMNVRFNQNAPSNTQIKAYYSSSTVYFSGRGEEGTNFYCYVPSDNGLYDTAVQVSTNLRNGSWLRVTRFRNSSVCQFIDFTNESPRLD